MSNQTTPFPDEALWVDFLKFAVSSSGVPISKAADAADLLLESLHKRRQDVLDAGPRLALLREENLSNVLNALGGLFSESAKLRTSHPDIRMTMDNLIRTCINSLSYQQNKP